MQRCWAITRNLQFCGRRGNWWLFCGEHRRQPLVWVFVLTFTVLAGTASILSYVEQLRFRETAQVKELPVPTPSPLLEGRAIPTSQSPAPLFQSPPVSDVKKTITPGQVTITGYLVDNYFGDVEHFGMLEGKVGEYYKNEQIDPMERIKSRSRATLLAPRSIRSGYSIVYYGPLAPEGTDSTKVWPSEGGTLRLDKVGNGLAKTILTFSKKGAGVRVEAIGQEANNRFNVMSMKEVEE